MKKPYLLCFLVTKPDDTCVTVLSLSKILYILYNLQKAVD